MELLIEKNLLLTVINTQHSSALYELIVNNREHLREWLPWVDLMKNEEFIENFVKASIQRFNDGLEYGFLILENEKIIGRIGVYKIDHANKTGEIGYWIGKEAGGRGIVIKSCKTLIRFCFDTLHLNRIEIKCGTENTRSQAIPVKLNFTKEGIIRQGELLHGKFIDLFLYSLLKAD
jgi:ribosomal-protein-serine acetyltransferase